MSSARNKLIDKCLGAVDVQMSAYEAVKALADAGLLADPEKHAELREWRDSATTGGGGWSWGRVRQALGVPDGRAVSVHAAEVVAERDALQARIDEPCAECRRLGRRCTEARQRARTAESERDKLKAAVGDVLKTLDHHAVCCFQFCAGPDEPFEEMKTCRVCSSIQDLRAALQSDQPTAALSGVELRSVEERDDASEGQS